MLTERFHQAPLKISKTFELSPGGELLVYMMDASPGILDGDRYEIQMHLGEGTQVYLTNQSYTKVHPTPKESSAMVQTFTLERGSMLEYFPEPLIPYADSKFRSDTVFHLSEDAVVMYGDIVTPGRIHHGEQFLYERLDSHMEAYRDGKLIAWDHFHLKPRDHRFRTLGALEHYTHAGALWIFAPGVNEEILRELRAHFPAEGLLIGASLTAEQGLLVRMLGTQVWKLQETMQTLAGLCRKLLLDKEPHRIRR
ncbi:hypothetical protein SY83_08005 [Paenibacillus swuensis]|uniref:Urease accessory protein UreD n=1 Tax=Paenibacillus swuensis TaxID=1178515 RepID=A0A172TP11_9BACL|nr:hypothetical protein SY83_08005 [Paenibacillus swuensis]